MGHLGAYIPADFPCGGPVGVFLLFGFFAKLLGLLREAPKHVRVAIVVFALLHLNSSLYGMGEHIYIMARSPGHVKQV